MRHLVGLDELEPQPDGVALTIGTFDGVHIGHRALIARAQEAAERLGCESGLLTWDRHPAATLRPDKVPPLLTTPERKVELIEATDLDVLAILSFDTELSHWPPERFVADVLMKGLGVKCVIVGEDWRFGHKATGDVVLLAELGRSYGFEVDAVGLIEIAGEPASSSRVRRAVADGDLELARTLLGRPFDTEGIVVRGDDRGADLGFPTANIAIDASLAHPPRGVYACRARVGEAWHKAAVNVGVNPTFGGDPARDVPRIEAFLLGFSGDLYDQSLRIEFHARLRDELKFDSVDDLIAQMSKDVEQTDALIA